MINIREENTTIFYTKFLDGCFERTKAFKQPLYLPLVVPVEKSVLIPKSTTIDMQPSLFLEVRSGIISGIVESNLETFVDSRRGFGGGQNHPTLLGFLLSFGHCYPNFLSEENVELTEVFNGKGHNLRDLNTSVLCAQRYIMTAVFLQEFYEKVVSYHHDLIQKRYEGNNLSHYELMQMIKIEQLQGELHCAEKLQMYLPYLGDTTQLYGYLLRYISVLYDELPSPKEYRSKLNSVAGKYIKMKDSCLSRLQTLQQKFDNKELGNLYNQYLFEKGDFTPKSVHFSYIADHILDEATKIEIDEGLIQAASVNLASLLQKLHELVVDGKIRNLQYEKRPRLMAALAILGISENRKGFGQRSFSNLVRKYSGTLYPSI